MCDLSLCGATASVPVFYGALHFTALIIVLFVIQLIFIFESFTYL